MSLVLENPINRFEDNPEAPAGAEQEAFYEDDGLLAVAGPIMVLCYVLLLLVAAFTFFGNGSALFAVMISAGFALIYFVVPIILLRVSAARDPRHRKDIPRIPSTIVGVATGPIKRWEALVQIVSVPIAIFLGFALLALRWSLL